MSETDPSPTEIQRRLRTRYNRTTGWCGTFGVILLGLCVYNVAKGLNAFGSLPMLLELGLAAAFLVPAGLSISRRRKLDKLVAEGSAEVPRHLKRWQIWSVIVGAFVLAAAMVSLPVLVQYASSPTPEEQQEAYVAAYRAGTYEEFATFPNLSFFCARMALPEQRGRVTSVLVGQIRSQPTDPRLSDMQKLEIVVDVIDELCGTG